MFWNKENEETRSNQATVKTVEITNDYLCPNCGLPLLRRPFDSSMKMSAQYELQKYDYHCAVCNQAFDRFKIEVN